MLRFSAAVMAVVLCALATAQAAVPDRALHYDLKAVIEPSAGAVSVEGTIDATASGPELRFILHKTFEISKLTVDGKKAAFSYGPDGPTPVAHFVVVSLPKDAAGTPIRLGIAYHGALEKVPEWGSTPEQRFGMDDQVNDKLVLLAVYSFWYPVLGPYGSAFATDLEVSLPQGWTAVSGGALRNLGVVKGRTITRWSVKNNFDIALSASPSYKRIAARGVEIYTVRLPESFAAAEIKDVEAVMALFRDKLGATEVPGGVLRHVYAPLEHGQGRAGFARPGLIVTSEGRVREAMAANPGYTLFQDVAHEIAHFWWHMGVGQGDWVNEAFAEYFSALSVRELVSKEKFEAALDGYRKGVAGLPKDAPSLATVPQEGGDAWTIRYQKGSLMLDDFRRSMGDEAFFAGARTFFQTYKNAQIGTAEFRAFWKPRLGANAGKLDAWVDSTGGVPATGK